MNEFIEIHVMPKNEARIIRIAFIAGVRVSQNGGCMIVLNGRDEPLQVSDSYEGLRAALLEPKEGKS